MMLQAYQYTALERRQRSMKWMYRCWGQKHWPTHVRAFRWIQLDDVAPRWIDKEYFGKAKWKFSLRSRGMPLIEWQLNNFSNCQNDKLQIYVQMLHTKRQAPLSEWGKLM